MAEISNKALAILLVLAIAISLGGTFVSLSKISQLVAITGQATTGVGYTNITVATALGIAIYENIDFGTGWPSVSGNLLVNTSTDNSGNGFNDCSGATYVCSGIKINNNGNLNANISVNLTTNATEFLGAGTSPEMKFYATNGADEGNGGAGCGNLSGHKEVIVNATASDDQDLCAYLGYNATNDNVTFELHLVIPDDAPTGSGNATVTITAVQS